MIFQPSWVFKTGDKKQEFKVSELIQDKRTEMGEKKYKTPNFLISKL